MAPTWRNNTINFVIAMVLLGLFFYFVGVEAIIESVRQASPLFILLGVIATFGTFIIRGLNWHITLSMTDHDMELGETLQYYLAALFVYGINPFGPVGGQPVMAYILSEDSEKDYEISLASIFAADLMNTLPFFTFAGLGILLYVALHPINPVITVSIVLAMILATSIALLLFLLFFHRSLAEYVFTWIIGVLNRVLAVVPYLSKTDVDTERIGDKIHHFYYTLDQVIDERRNIADILIIAHVGWFLIMVGLYSFILSMGWTVSFTLLMFIIPIAYVVYYLPLPGGLGGIEVMLTLLLILLADLPSASASAAVILFRGSSYGLVMLIGLAVLLHRSIDLSEYTFADDRERMLPKD
ncbi:MAG: flippase-like domain-containing protein [Candidatus Nanohaloarchaeota archaeon QJJ-5]|nr:flippase-like domain-containing protein [Candidatus Nanohaloarchaeota archaeon QJJ-5]